MWAAAERLLAGAALKLGDFLVNFLPHIVHPLLDYPTLLKDND